MWERRRVRRGFGRSSRQRLIDELQFWNNALKTCLDKTELPRKSDTPTAAVEAIRAKFISAGCTQTRLRDVQVHRAVSRAWRCHSHEHQGNFKLSWHDAGGDATRIRLVFPFWEPAVTSWQEIACDAMAPSVGTAALPPSGAAPVRTSSIKRRQPDTSSRPWKRMKDWIQPVFSSRGKEAEVSVISLSRLPASEPAPCSTIPPSAELPPEVNCLCSYVHNPTQVGRLAIHDDNAHYTSDYDSPQIRMEHLGSINLAAAAPLGSMLGSTFTKGLALSRRDRFAAASAASWAVLYLAGSPWIGPHWSGKQGLCLLSEMQALHSLRHYPAISCLFRDTSRPEGGQSPRVGQLLEEMDGLRMGIIRNRTLFALGILLIELYLDTPFENLRQGHHAGTSSASLGMAQPIDDYEVANACMQRVYLEAGDLYGYAVQRCPRCEFPGRDMTESFEFEQFRTDFLHEVVAPVQATFSLLRPLYGVPVPERLWRSGDSVPL